MAVTPPLKGCETAFYCNYQRHVCHRAERASCKTIENARFSREFSLANRIFREFYILGDVCLFLSTYQIRCRPIGRCGSNPNPAAKKSRHRKHHTAAAVSGPNRTGFTAVASWAEEVTFVTCASSAKAMLCRKRCLSKDTECVQAVSNN